MRNGFLFRSLRVRAGLTLCSVGIVVLFASLWTRSHAAPSKRPLGVAPTPRFKSGEVIVKFKDSQRISSSGFSVHALLNTLGERYDVSVKQFETDSSLAKIKVENKTPMGEILTDLNKVDAIEYAEPNYIYYAIDGGFDASAAVNEAVPNDPFFSQLWGLLNVGQHDPKGQVGIAGKDIGAVKAWQSGTGSKDISVAIIDTGVDYKHEDLKDNIFINTSEIPGDGKDNDGNGFVDDIHGWNFVAGNNDPMDDNRHGTHCAGTIGGQGNNGVGVTGVAWRVSILPIKFLSGQGSGSLEDAVKSIQYATKMGVKIMSNSWGGGGYSQTMFDAIRDARDKGILFVAAASNDGTNNDEQPAYPASYAIDNVISVAATDNRDHKAVWSNYGRKTVHLAAPGVNIFSTAPMDKGKYATLSGTSMATPHVSGAAALLWSTARGMSYSEVRQRLLTTVDPVRGLYRTTITGGRLNVYNAINNIVPPRPQPPSGPWKSVAKVIESKHPYVGNTHQTFQIQHPGAKFMRLHVRKLSSESGYDVMTINSAAGETIEELSGEVSDYTTDYIEGDKVTIMLNSDDSNDEWGFVIDRYEFID